MFAIWIRQLTAENAGRTLARRGTAALLALAGILDVLAALATRFEPHFARLDAAVPFALSHGPRTFILLAGFGLLLLARGLWVGRRVAWLAALLLLGSAATTQLIGHLAGETAALQGGLAVALLLRRGDFLARPDPPTLAGIGRLGAIALVILGLYAALGFRLLHGQFLPPPTPALAAREFVADLLFVVEGPLRPRDAHARWFLDSLTIVWGVILLVAFAAILRAVRGPTPEDPRDRARAEVLLRDHGRQTIAAMTLWPGNILFLTAERDVYVAYRVIDGIALALGDPVGADAGVARALGEFVAHCAARGWTPCFYAASGRYRDAFRAVGLETLQIGEDTVIDLGDLAFRGKAWQDIRTALNRAEREGVRCEAVALATAPDTTMDQLRALSARWTAEKGLPEIDFTLGTLETARDATVRTMIAVDAAGIIHGVTTWLPVYEGGTVRGWTIDVMRRRLGPDAFHPVMEFLIARAAQIFREEGYRFISLSAAPLARAAGDDPQTGPLSRALEFLADRLEPFYGFRTLYAFKRKFQPRWEPIYLAYPGVTSLPGISLAIVRAYLPTLGLREVRGILSGLARRPAVGRRAPWRVGR